MRFKSSQKNSAHVDPATIDGPALPTEIAAKGNGNGNGHTEVAADANGNGKGRRAAKKNGKPTAAPVATVAAPSAPPAAPTATATIAPPAPSATSANGGAVQRLGELLVSRDLLTVDDLERALAQQQPDHHLGETLVAMNVVDERKLIDVLAQQLGVASVDLRRETPSEDALAALPEATARELGAIPMVRRDNMLDVAVADPRRAGLVDALAKASKCRVTLLLAPASEVRRAIDQSYRALADVERHIRQFELTSLQPARVENAPTLQQAVDSSAPVVQVVNLIVTQALRDRASDVHIEPMGHQIRVRMRIDGALQDVLTLPADMGPAIVSRIKVMSGMNIVERRRAQDGQFETAVDNRALDVRVSTTPVIHGEKTVLRLLDKSRSLYEMTDLGMPGHATEAFSDLLRSPFGMVLCAGPTGSGKTTTLYAALAEINTTERNITTIEDPVEYVLPTVNQIQINEAAEITFAGGLKSILRQDPDVILVGEIRDVETARIAVQSALTGHFVLSSLHATDAASAIHRFLDMGIEPFLIAPSVLAVVGQRLVRRICRECRAPYEPPADELAFYESIGGAEKTQFFHGEGCNFCSGTGYQERIGVYEVLRMTDAMRELIVDQPAYSELRKLAIAEGMHPLRDEALRLVAEDTTTIPEILRSVYPL
jgi:type IV pilus assembly protein PilB